MSNRPCTCDNIDGPQYRAGQCRLCWKWHYDPSYRQHWGGERTYSLPCIHLGAATGERRTCLTCPGNTRIKVFGCALHGVCTTHKAFADTACCEGCPERETLAPSITTIRGLPPGRSFNGSIAEWHGKTYLAYRKYWGRARVALVELDAAWQPIGLAKELSLGQLPEDRDCQEDPRLFHWRDQLCVVYTGCNWSSDRPVSICAARLDDALDVSQSWCPHFPERRAWEKNWGCFDHDGDLYSVYEIAPHRVLLHTYNNAWEFPRPETFHFPAGVFDSMRGGSSPIRVGDEYYSFFHSTPTDGQHSYLIGLYTFAAKPPFRPRRWIPTPLLWPNPAEAPGPHVAKVVFPGGAILRDGQWHVSYGYYDEQVRVASWKAELIERQLEPLPGVHDDPRPLEDASPRHAPQEYPLEW